MSIVQKKYRRPTDPQPAEPQTIVLVIDVSLGGDLDAVREKLEQPVEELRKEGHEVEQFDMATSRFTEHYRQFLRDVSLPSAPTKASAGSSSLCTMTAPRTSLDRDFSVCTGPKDLGRMNPIAAALRAARFRNAHASAPCWP